MISEDRNDSVRGFVYQTLYTNNSVRVILIDFKSLAFLVYILSLVIMSTILGRTTNFHTFVTSFSGHDFRVVQFRVQYVVKHSISNDHIISALNTLVYTGFEVQRSIFGYLTDNYTCSQVVGATAFGFVIMGVGLIFGMPTIVIGELAKPNATMVHGVALDEYAASWFGKNTTTI